MTSSLCRACGGSLHPRPLLLQEDMPKSAQFLPDETTVSEDRGLTLAIRQCAACGLVQLDTKPVPYFREVIRAAALSAPMMEFRTRQFSGFVEKHGLAGKKVVEIGCGRGDYLAALSRQAVTAVGFEQSAAAVEHCRKSGLRAEQGYLEDATTRIPGGPFDAFLIMNFLEHIPDPRALLAGIRGNLVPGGVGIVEVPNFSMIVREKIFSEFIPDHLFYFTRETLRSLLEQNGFEVLACEEIWESYIISVVVRSRTPQDLSALRVAQESVTRELHGFLASVPNGCVAIWGAGHQAFAAMALAGLAGKIRYVVDSAPFKQGKYTPSTHIPIVAPSRLASDPVSALIVMAGGYSDEVAKIVRRDYPQVRELRILRGGGLERA